jgi:predicted ArsR family transcriptional regulator
MADDTTSTGQTAFTAIDDQMSADRAALLAAVARATEDDGGGIPTGQLREAVGIPSGSMPYHMGALTEWELVEVVGNEKEGGGSPSKVFALTERGEKFLNRSTISQFPSVEDVHHLEERVAELETELETIQDEQRRMRDAYNQMADIVEDLHETTQNA